MWTCMYTHTHSRTVCTHTHTHTKTHSQLQRFLLPFHQESTECQLKQLTDWLPALNMLALHSADQGWKRISAKHTGGMGRTEKRPQNDQRQTEKKRFPPQDQDLEGSRDSENGSTVTEFHSLHWSRAVNWQVNFSLSGTTRITLKSNLGVKMDWW